MATDRADTGRDIYAHVVPLVGNLDLASRRDLMRLLDEAAEAESHNVIADLSPVTFIYCAGLRLLLAAHRRLDGRLRLHNPSQPVQRLVDLLDLSSLAT
jgi:anti-anti-sigma factor